MRIIAGALKGRRLIAPSWPGLRPTSDKLRETIFDILAPRIAGATVLDGYAGTGAVGIEAMSRGAAAVTFVERDRRAQALIAQNLARCGIVEGYAIIRASLERALETLRKRPAGDRLDIVFLDPPYDRDENPEKNDKNDRVDLVIAAVGELIARDGILVLEHARKRPGPETAGCLIRTRQVTAGDSALAFYACRP
jgi:16S rRNA (guanine966-N2)-methyltransferase